MDIATTRVEMEALLRGLGIGAGTHLVMHSSFRSVGHFEGGPENFCRMLCELVTPEGLVMMPGLVRYPADGQEFTYNPLTTPTNTGILPETFRKMPGVQRSLDPTHSFCAWGKNAGDFLREHHRLPTMHARSPLGLLERAGGYCLLLGVPRSTTFMHVVETACGAQCLGSRTERYPAVLPDGRRVTLRAWGWRDGKCRALRHEEIFGYMRDKHALQERQLRNGPLLYFRLSDYREAYSRLLLAPEGGCAGCPVRPRQVSQNIATDWDSERDCLMPSEAFTE